ncbi:MAG: hypothetical protein GXP36_12865, partial [Actinobacteria bacterium]|nr:hypothetical protein [Actinomycetota bacterium]
MVIELAATWLAQQLFVDVAKGIWDHLKDSVMGYPLSTALEQTIDEAIRLSIVEAGGDIDINEEALDHVVAVFNQLWPTTDITETAAGLSLLDRFRQLTQVAMQICAEPVEGLGDSQPVSSLSIIADKHDLVLDPDSFAMLLADRWVGVITDRAVNNEVLKPVADQLNADRIFSGVSALHDKIDPDSP